MAAGANVADLRYLVWANGLHDVDGVKCAAELHWAGADGE
jgi:hypothetical protein